MPARVIREAVAKPHAKHIFARDVYKRQLLNVDQYMALADFASYSHAQQKAEQLYKDQTKWNSMSLVNTAKAGIFAADRAIRDYANTIWLAKPVETKKK